MYTSLKKSSFSNLRIIYKSWNINFECECESVLWNGRRADISIVVYFSISCVTNVWWCGQASALYLALMLTCKTDLCLEIKRASRARERWRENGGGREGESRHDVCDLWTDTKQAQRPTALVLQSDPRPVGDNGPRSDNLWIPRRLSLSLPLFLANHKLCSGIFLFFFLTI